MADHRLFTLWKSAGAGVLASWLALSCASMPQGALAAGDGEGTTPVAHIVTMEGMGFEPKTLTVKPGDRVTWVNKDLVPHTATAASQAFDSRSIAPDASWSYTAGKPGSYPYVCQFHPGMQGTLVVQQQSAQ